MAYIYAFQLGNDDMFKIGKTSNSLEKRRNQLQISCPQTLTLFRSLSFATSTDALFGFGDAGELTLLDQGALELRDSADDVEHPLGDVVGLARPEGQALLDERHGDPTPGHARDQAAKIAQVAGEAVHRVDHHRVAFAKQGASGFVEQLEHPYRRGVLVLVAGISSGTKPSSGAWPGDSDTPTPKRSFSARRPSSRSAS